MKIHTIMSKNKYDLSFIYSSNNIKITISNPPKKIEKQHELNLNLSWYVTTMTRKPETRSVSIKLQQKTLLH